MTDENAKFFPEYGSDYRFPEFERTVLDSWKKFKIFDRVLEQSKKHQTYFFYDGPPFATGLPHYGHILAGTIKDVVPRYWTMRGRYVPRRFGWDTHGLPVEFEMEKTLGLNGSPDIVKYGVDRFNEACRGIVLRYAQEWRKSVERMGRWIDMDHDYKTMDPQFMESVWWVFKELWNRGLIYEGKKVVPYSWRLTAPLSNFEASQNYKDVQDPAITVLFQITGFAQGAKLDSSWLKNTAFAVWTTTPWTLPANLAVAIHPDAAKVRYARFKLADAVGEVTHVIMAENLGERYGLSGPEFINNNELVGTHYSPLFSCYVDEQRKKENAFRVVAAEYVSANDGTGLVHQAPAFGEDDFFVCKQEGISLIDPTDMNACFLPEVAKDPALAPIVGLHVKEADKLIIKALKDSKRLLKQETINHPYPFCERSDTPLIYKAISSWFVKVEDVKSAMLKSNQQIRWVPAHIKDGRFGNWLENARDWCISRNRFWGTPIPVWKCQSCGHVEVVGSRAELAKVLGFETTDLHSHVIDKTKGHCPKCASKYSMQRTPEVLDCWFESGSMPFAQEHYPFENKESFEKSFPADFIAEGLDQTRGWFYTLTVLSSALLGKPAFKNCIVNGMILAEDGKKMSKRLKNYPDPNEIFEKYGADALRLYLIQSPAMHAEELRFSEKGLLELMRAVMLPLWNAYSFFASYANIDGWKPGSKALQKLSLDELDEWILARATETEIRIHHDMESYQLSSVAPSIVSFIDDLTNWYIRLSRNRFWSDARGANPSKEAAHHTLWFALDRLSTMLAPFLPFYAEVLAAALRGQDVATLNRGFESVHERSFLPPKALDSAQEALLERVALAKKVILLGRSLRGEAKIGLRQPLLKLRVAGVKESEFAALGQMKPLILKELNVKEIEIVDKAADLVEESIKPNHRVLGKKVGKDMKAIQDALARWNSAKIAQFEETGVAELLGYSLVSDDLQIVRKAKPGKFAMAGSGVVVELDTTMTDALVNEGLAREVINRVQQLRKELKFELSDRIHMDVDVTKGSRLDRVLRDPQLAELVRSETLTMEVSFRVLDDSLVHFQEVLADHGRLKIRCARVS